MRTGTWRQDRLAISDVVGLTGINAGGREAYALQLIAMHGLPSEMTPMLDAPTRLFERMSGLMAPRAPVHRGRRP
jgi:hypothetical protein